MSGGSAPISLHPALWTPRSAATPAAGGPARNDGPLPFGRQGTGWETAYATLFLMSRESAYMTAQTLVVDGGLIDLWWRAG